MAEFNAMDTAAFKGVWVFCEQREGKLMPTDFELISKGRDLADELGVKYYTGFAVNCIRDTYLKDHDAPEDCEYYLCGPPMLIKTVTDYLDSLGVEPESIMYDNFG